VGEDERVRSQDSPAEPGATGGTPLAQPAATDATSSAVDQPKATEPAEQPKATEPAAQAKAQEPGAPGAGAPGPAPSSQKPPKKRRSRKRRWIMGLSIFFGVIVILVIAAFVTAHYTSASSFCDTCHEMNPYYISWQASDHASAQCRDCHIPPGAIPYIETKLGSFREIWVHFSGNPDAPLAVTREIPNASCFRCHSNPPSDPTLPTVSFTHAKAHASLDCIMCHVRLVHRTVNPPSYKDPAQMSSCMECHNGTVAPANCSYCHTAPHEVRGECSACHSQQGWQQQAGT
jgi:cytochrome c nitrite reductase small subunit